MILKKSILYPSLQSYELVCECVFLCAYACSCVPVCGRACICMCLMCVHVYVCALHKCACAYIHFFQNQCEQKNLILLLHSQKNLFANPRQRLLFYQLCSYVASKQDRPSRGEAVFRKWWARNWLLTANTSKVLTKNS